MADDEDDSQDPRPLPEKTEETSNGEDRLGGIPRPLKIAAVVIPLIATVCAGIWAVMTQYVELKKAVEKERTTQAQYQKEQAEQKVAEAKLKLDAEKEVTTRQQLQQQFIAASKNQDAELQRSLEELKSRGQEAETALQRLKTEEQQTRERISKNEFDEKQTAAELQEDQAVSAAISVVLAPDEKSDADAALGSLLRYVNKERHRSVIVAALSEKSSRIRSIEQAQLFMRVVRAVSPVDLDLIITANRIGRQHLAHQCLPLFWHVYADHYEEVAPDSFLNSSQGLPHCATLFYDDILREIYKRFPEIDPKKPRQSFGRKTIAERLPDILKETSSAAVEGEAYSVITSGTGKLLYSLLESPPPNLPATVDISGCYLPASPMIAVEIRSRIVKEDLLVDRP